MNDYRFAVFEKVKDIFEGNAGFPGLEISVPNQALPSNMSLTFSKTANL